ncbi:hypothetical protein BG011_004784 [Mortierella polycephala]|uniref:DDT domain-containing protein n=1 Tax=Mortierella polycephala TaxID=41804 RepID=A0A9P6QCK8_9FUNG|nr:hypothetical protein BG011_004784 [Mortierella polycephala]
MTVPANTHTSNIPQGKLRPLTSLNPPMLPTEQELRDSSIAHQTPIHQRPKLPSPQNSLLSSWLSNGSGSVNNGSNSSSSGAIPITTEHGFERAVGVGTVNNSQWTGGVQTQKYHIQEAPEKAKKGRKPKLKPEGREATVSGTKPAKEKKPKVPKEPKEPKIPKAPKEPKMPKELKQKKMKTNISGEPSGTPTGARGKADRSILSFFDRSANASLPKAPTFASGELKEHRGEGDVIPGNSRPMSTFKQSCLSFDVLDASQVGSYFSSMASGSTEDGRRIGGFMKELPKLTGRAPYEDLLSGMLMRSSRLPTLNNLDLRHPELDMDMLADVKMVHEFLNTFGTPLGLTEDSGEWITFDMLLSMIRNPRIDDRLLDLNCKMVLAAYEDGRSPKINMFNFPYFLAVGPEAMLTLEERKVDNKKNKHGAAAGSYSKKKVPSLGRLGTIEYSVYTIADRIEALVKALHDITSSDRFHRFMRNEVEENITTLKREKRKRAEIRKDLETQTHDLEREMKAIEREASELEEKRQAILAAERESGSMEDEAGAGAIKATSRQQRLAQAKDARTRANDLLNQQKVLASDLKAKETAWETKKEELEGISMDDTEIQKDHNVPLTQLRGGYAVNTDEKLRVICLGSDRWGRKYWFWKNFGGVIVEDRDQIGPKLDEAKSAMEPSAAEKHSTENKDQDIAMESTESGSFDKEASEVDASMSDVTQRMKTMAQPELAGDRFQSTKDRMSISNLLFDSSTIEEPEPFMDLQSPSEPVSKPAPEKDLLDYGPIQTWSLISTSKELASLIRALNGKGIRERVLKASLTTMRKEIESSFSMIKTWAGHEYAVDNAKPVSVQGAVGQPLSEEDLMLLKKKRGRKSRQELADIAATQLELAAMGEDKSMDLDHPDSADSLSTIHPDIDMDMDGAERDKLHGNENTGYAVDGDKELDSGFLAPLRDMQSGSSPSEYLASIVQAANGKLRGLSRAICNGQEDAILKVVEEAQGMNRNQPQDQLLAAVKVLDLCLAAMDEPPDMEEMGDEEASEMIIESDGIINNDDKDIAMDGADADRSAEGSSSLSLAIPVAVNPRLLTWLRTCRIDSMLKEVRTFGSLYAWLDECIDSVASMVYDADEDNEGDEDMDGMREKDEEDEEAEDHEQNEDEDEDDDDDERDQEDEEAEEAGDDKAQEDGQGDNEDEEEGEQHRRNQRKARKEPQLKVSNIRGRSLRSRCNKPTSYKYELKEMDEDDEDAEEDRAEDDEDDEEDQDAPALRRSKRIRH